MRLIDADALMEEIKSLQVIVTGLRAGKGILNEYAKHYRESLLKTIDEHPTAYDIDKVVKELYEQSEKNRNIAFEYEKEGLSTKADKYYHEQVGFLKSIGIVKQGGVTYDCNNCANYTEPDEIDNGCYLCCKGYENNYKSKADNGGVSDDVCEWQSYYKFVSDKYKRVTSCGYEFYDLHHAVPFKFCPYCGKKIKVGGD